MKKEFPFGWALLFALACHAILGIFLKQNPLLIAAPIPPAAANAPVKMHFFESPPGAKTTPSAPNAKVLSDATRKAGPLVKSEKREPRSTQYAQKVQQPAQQRPSRTQNSARPGGSPNPAGAQTALPPIQQPQMPSNRGEADYRTPTGKPDDKRLAQSLRNLDQFLGSGEGSGSGSPTPGDLPTGDTGSGVFFDTQGFDLGPWANRVVAIVRSNWIVPVAAQLGVKGIVGVSFQVDRSGRIINIQVITPSGTPSFDQAAANALKTSSPLPPLPADFPRQILPGVFRFYYNVPVPKN